MDYLKRLPAAQSDIIQCALGVKMGRKYVEKKAVVA